MSRVEKRVKQTICEYTIHRVTEKHLLCHAIMAQFVGFLFLCETDGVSVSHKKGQNVLSTFIN